MPGDALYSAWCALRSHPLRTLLTAASVAAGVCSVVLLSSIARSGMVSMASGLEAIGGAELLVVFPKRARGPRARYARPLSGDDALALEGQLSQVRWISAQSVLGPLTVTAGDRQTVADVVASDARMSRLLKLGLQVGRDLAASDNQGSRRVAVLADAVARKLFVAGERAIGRLLHLRGEAYTVIGVLAPIPAFAFDPGYDLDNLVLVPHSQAVAPHLSLVMIGTAGRAHNAGVAAAATRILAYRHRGADDFRVFDFSVRLDESKRLLSIVELLAAAVAGVALLASAAGTINVLLLSIEEHLREIGLRKTLGAPSSIVMRQFLWQAALIAALGATTGVALGLLAVRLGGALIARVQPGWVTTVATRPALLAVLVAFAVTMLASLVPGWRARRLAIVDCLRARP